MAMNWAWIGLFTVAFATALMRWALGEDGILPALLSALFDGARSGFEISLGLAGVMAQIERLVRDAAPFPSLGSRTSYIDTWLWDRSGRFQLDTLTTGHLQQG